MIRAHLVCTVATVALLNTAAAAAATAAPGDHRALLAVTSSRGVITIVAAGAPNSRTVRLIGLDDVSQLQVSTGGTTLVALDRSGRLMAFDISTDNPFISPYASLDKGSTAVTNGSNRKHSLIEARFAFVIDGIPLIVDDNLRVMNQQGLRSDLIAIAMRGRRCALSVSTKGDVSLVDVETGHVWSRGSISVSADDQVQVVAVPPEVAESCAGLDNDGFGVIVRSKTGRSVIVPGYQGRQQTGTAGEMFRELAEFVGSTRADQKAAILPPRAWAALVQPDISLYAPVLELASQESTRPSRIDVWHRLTANAASADWWPLYEQYAAITEGRECAVYFRVVDLSSTWLIQFWLYFPFDVGNRSPHLHDSEHVFVEVDKRGGIVQRVLGAGHGFFSGNNLYTADLATGYGLDLPIYAFVELGKHATAPDTDRNGFFTPGVDENHYNERSKVWGVRDVIGSINNELLSYETSMTVPRSRESRYALQDFLSRFPTHSGVPSENCVCELIEWQPPPSVDCVDGPGVDAATLTACAAETIQTHPDYDNLNAIFKSQLFPPWAVQVGGSYGEHDKYVAPVIGLLADVQHTRVLAWLPLAGRVGIRASLPGDSGTTLGRPRRLTLSYERLVSNLVGVSLHTTLATKWGYKSTAFGIKAFAAVPLGSSGWLLAAYAGPTVVGGSRARFAASLAVEHRIGRGHRFQ